MRVMRLLVGASLLLGLLVSSRISVAQSKTLVHAKPTAKAAKPARPLPKPKKSSKPAEPESAPAPDEAPPEVSEEPVKPSTEGETRVKAAGTSAAPQGAVKAKEKEGPEGVKTYQFGAIEVEGRLKSPQLIYFLRRVRAEFEAGALGHRSFLGELSDTRNETTFR